MVGTRGKQLVPVGLSPQRQSRAGLASSFALMLVVSGCTDVAKDDVARTRTVSHREPLQLDDQLVAIGSDLAGPEQDIDVIFSQEIANGMPVANLVTGRPNRRLAVAGEWPLKPAPDPRPLPAVKVHEAVSETIAAMKRDGKSGAIMSVIVLFQEKFRIPRFPGLRVGERRDSPANAARMIRAEELVGRIQTARAPDHERIRAELAHQGAKVRETYWLVNAMTVDVPADEIAALAEREDVVRIEPTIQGSLATNQLSDSRYEMSTDAYFNLGLTAGWIGILDSGVRSTHTLLSGRLGWVRDCTNGTSSLCTIGSGLNPEDQISHGTAVANIVGGNGNLGNDLRGITGIEIDSFKVTSGATGSLDAGGVLRGFSASVAGGDAVINCSFGAGTDVDSSIAAAANAAFDAGSVVVGATANSGPNSGTAQVPGAARKVLGVGAVNVTSWVLRSDSGRGPTVDQRIKPDVVGLNNIYAASSVNDTSTLLFAQTSCATPHISAAAGLFHNWIVASIPNVDPGQVNAFMIAQANNMPFNNDVGAGLVQLSTGGATWFAGKTTATAGNVVQIPITLSGTTSRVDVALWWPDPSGRHNDVDLFLRDPSGASVDSSRSGGSVFEKIAFTTTTSGVYKIEVMSYDVVGSQPVYFAAFQTH